MSKQSRKASKRKRDKARKERRKQAIESLAEDLKEIIPWEPGPPVPKRVIFDELCGLNHHRIRAVNRLWPTVKQYLADQGIFVRQIRSKGGGILLTHNIAAAVDAEDHGERVIKGSVKHRNIMRKIMAQQGASMPALGIHKRPRLPSGRTEE